MLAALALSACVERLPATVAFSSEEAAYIHKQGDGVIIGHAFRTRASGTVVNAAGQVVHLVPATAFARERFAQIYGNRKFVPDHMVSSAASPDPRYIEYTRNTKAESNGRFVFENVAPGSYFVATQVIWGDEAALFRQGGSVQDMVTLTGKERGPVQVILSGH